MDLRKALQELQGKTRPPVDDKASRAPLIEIFHSIQGEGRFVGVPMAFVRTATCPLRCLYCDTPNSYKAPPTAPVRFGVRTSQEPNPVTAPRAAELVRQVTQAALPGLQQKRVSVTGGEPLVFPEFVRDLGRLLRDQGFRLHLETAALDAKALELCVGQVDHLSADYKLPETLGEPEKAELRLLPGNSYGERHLRCVEVALRRGASVDVKIVLTDKVLDPGFERALADLTPVKSKVLLVLQPVTPFGAVHRALPGRDLERFVATAVREGFDVRVVPQTHKTLQVP
ncbi:MAG: 7-carboxy-7-deazaguanine synthase QueE [Planctomycetes bacterium]|nr:7-carboxy-7-deazaguanine synthase QueE [Planctomycetota bacterium]